MFSINLKHSSRRTKNRSNQTGGPHIYTDLLRSDNNQESLAQDHVYSAVRESRISSITGTVYAFSVVFFI